MTICAVLLWVGGVLLVSGMLGIVRFETGEGFRHLFDRTWIMRGHGLTSGTTAAAINITNRMMIGVGALAIGVSLIS